jgi:hypothetical protein
MRGKAAQSQVHARFKLGTSHVFLLLGAPYSLVAPRFTETIERLIREWAVVERVFRV